MRNRNSDNPLLGRFSRLFHGGANISPEKERVRPVIMSVDTEDSLNTGDYLMPNVQAPSVNEIHVIGNPHIHEQGSVFVYYPLTSNANPTGGLAEAARDVVRNSNYFISLFQRMQGFREIPAIVFEQDRRGGIYELILRPVPATGDVQTVIFAVRYYDPGATDGLPLGLDFDGGPLVVLNDPLPGLYNEPGQDPGERHTSVPNEAHLKRSSDGSQLGDYLHRIGREDLEFCLFMSAFNIDVILEHEEYDPATARYFTQRIETVREDAIARNLPRAVLFGRLGMIEFGDPPTMELVTTSLHEDPAGIRERADIFFWLNLARYENRLQQYAESRQRRVLPLLQLEGQGTYSIIIGRSKNHVFGHIDSTDAAALNDRNRYNSVNLKHLVSRHPTLRLKDLLLPLLFNTYIAPRPSIRVTDSLESIPNDIRDISFIHELIHGNGLVQIERTQPFLYRQAYQSALQASIDTNSIAFKCALVDEICSRFLMLGNLPAKRVRHSLVDEDEIAARLRAAQQPLLAENFRKKFEVY